MRKQRQDLRGEKEQVMGKRNGTGEARIPCKVAVGMFSDEREVFIHLPDGRSLSALVDKRDVLVKSDPEEGKPLDGEVKVSVVEQYKGMVLVDLPQAGITVGPRMQVPKTFLKK